MGTLPTPSDSSITALALVGLLMGLALLLCPGHRMDPASELEGRPQRG